MNKHSSTAATGAKIILCHCEEVRRLFAGPTKQSFLCLGRAIRRGGLPSLLLLVFSATAVKATDLAHIEIIWVTPVPGSLQAQIESTVGAGQGNSVTESRITRLIESTLSLLSVHGYHSAVVEPRQFRLANDSLSFELAIRPGPVTKISKWELIGLVRTDSLWLARALDLPTNVPATHAYMIAATARLSGFSNLSLSAPPEIAAADDDSAVVIRLHLRERTPARFEGGLAAGSTDAADGALLGRLSLRLNGLFRRDHSVDVRYEHPQPDERLMRLQYSERLALWRHLSTQLEFEDWRRSDHRQQIDVAVSFTLSHRRQLAAVIGAKWQKLTPLSSTNAPARLLESSLGLSWGREEDLHITLEGIHSRHRLWDRVTTLEDAHSRLRIEAEGSWAAALGRSGRLRLSSGGRWWGRGVVLRTGDEWFLGGDILAGYPARSLAAGEGLWSRIEMTRVSASGFGAAIFGETAWLTMFDTTFGRPSSLGFALLLDSPGRSGRLEMAWNDRASLRDGILRLSVIQGW